MMAVRSCSAAIHHGKGHCSPRPPRHPRHGKATARRVRLTTLALLASVAAAADPPPSGTFAFGQTLALNAVTASKSWLRYVESVDGDLIIGPNVSSVEMISLREITGSLVLSSTSTSVLTGSAGTAAV